jgi:hypothetical protein
MVLRKKRKFGTKGQANLMETIGVLFIFFILVLFGLIFYFKFQEVSFAEKQIERTALDAIDTTLVTLFLPELQCSNGRAESDDNCVDLVKLRMLQKVLDESQADYRNEYYFNMFGFSKISFQEVYPNNRSWTLYDREKTKMNEEGIAVPDWRIKEPTFFVVTFRDYIHGFAENVTQKVESSFGYVQVEVYS